jgi:hypothetical protein
MNATEMSQVLLDGLIELERSGDLVITHASPLQLADDLCSRVIQHWSNEFASAPPDELVIADAIRSSTKYLHEIFSLSREQALEAVERFVEARRSERTLTALAELLAHQGPQEIAMGAYYCVHLQMGPYYGEAYLAWRSEQNSKLRQAGRPHSA